MDLGELPEHQDFGKLLLAIQKEVDRRTSSVIAGSSNKSIEEIRFASGGLEALAWLLENLRQRKV